MSTNMKTNRTYPTDTLSNDVEHPIGTGVGAAGGAVAGASIGAAGGPIGMAAGAAVGAVIGAVTGEAVTESLDFTKDDDQYFRDSYPTRPYQSTASYETYRPAYQYGATAHGQYSGKRYDDVRSDLQSGWEKSPSASSFGWDKAEPAVRDAYEYRSSFNATKKAS